MIMSLLTLELKSESDLELLISFAKRLNAVILDITKTQTTTDPKQNPVAWLEKIAKNGGIQSITNPSEWQKEIRMDSVLLNRE